MVFNAPALARYARYGLRSAYGALAYGAYRGGRALYNKPAFGKKPWQKWKGKPTLSGKPKPSAKRGFRKFKGQEEGHTISASQYKNIRNPTKAEIMLKSAIPQVAREISQNFTSAIEGSQQFLNLVDAWSYSTLTTYGPAVSTTSESRFFVEGGHLKLVMTNITSTPINVTIYDYVFKNDLPAGITIEQLITNGFVAKYNVANQQNVPWMNPTESAEFREYVKINSSSNIVLSPGENHIHDYYFTINKYFTPNKWTNLTPPVAVRNFTNGIFVRTLGSVVTDGISTKVSYGASKTAFITHKKLNFKTPQSTVAARLTATQSGLPQTGLVAEKFMDEDTGVATVNATV